MKSKTFVFVHETAKANCLAEMQATPVDGACEWVKRTTHQSKTMAQLGAVFGVWIQYLSKELGESEHSLHQTLKAMFLARVYITEPLGPNQEQWVELLAIYQETGQMEKLERHAERISLSWATCKQMKDYMDAIESHYMSIGKPLPILDRFRRAG